MLNKPAQEHNAMVTFILKDVAHGQARTIHSRTAGDAAEDGAEILVEFDSRSVSESLVLGAFSTFCASVAGE